MGAIKIKNAQITSTALTIEDHGILTAWIHLDYGGVHQGFGGWSLESDSKFCSAFIRRVLEIAGVSSWEKLPGKSVRVKAEHNKIHAIGHYLNDEWFSPEELANETG